MSIRFTYTTWEKENNFEFLAGEYQSLEEFIDLIKSSEQQINDRFTHMLEQRGDLIPGTAKHKLHAGQEGSKKVNHSTNE